jgi:alpha-L-rhamnosidase
MLADIGFRVGANQTAQFSDVTIKNYRFPSNALFTEKLNSTSYSGIFKSANLTIENGAYKIKGNALILADPSKNAAPMLRTTFATQAKPIKALVCT